MKKKTRLISGIVGGVIGFVSFSAAFGSVPKNVTNDTALYQRLSEIKATHEKELSFDRDIALLASSESKYRERLPELSSHPRLKAPMHRISQKPYHFSGSPNSRTSRQ